MDNKEFDDIIKQKLESLNSSNTDGGWDALKQKWQESSVEQSTDNSNETSDSFNDLFDAKIKHNLSSLRVPNNSEHWIKLKTQLESESLFKKKLFVAKTVEVLMLVLIVVGILNIMPIQNNISDIPVFDVPMVSSIQVDEKSAEKHDHNLSNKSKQRVLLNQRINEVLGIDILPSQIKLKEQKEIKPISRQKDDATPNVRYTQVPNIDILVPFMNFSPKRPENIVNGGNIYNKSNKEIKLLDNESSNLEMPVRPLGLPDITLGPKKKISKENSFVSLAIGPKVNLVNSPFDPVYKIDPYNTLNTNFNISAKLHKDLGPIEMYAGLGYSKTSYKPLIVEEIYKTNAQEYNQASLENIGFSTVNIPIGVSYNLLDQDNYKLYATAGIDVNLIAKAEYEVYDLPASGYRGGENEGQKTSLDKGTPKINQRALLSQKEFRKGIIDGGSLKDNLYASANIGVGLIKNVSETTSLFIEPKYSHFISSQGLGPNLDKLHAVSVDLGVKYQLN